MATRRCWTLVAVAALFLGSCSALPVEPTVTPQPTATDRPPPTATDTPTETPEPTETPLPSATPTPSASPTASMTPTPSVSPTASSTPTPEPLTITANGSVNCRYGPSKAYLYAWGLSDGDTATVKGTNANRTWLWVQPDATNWTCWVSASAVEADGDLETVRIVYPQLLTHPDVAAPKGVKAQRSGQKVTISWDPAPPAEGLGYLIEARICLGTYLWDVAYSTSSTSYTVEDPTSCAGDSYGQLRVYNKLGYSTAVKIPWP